MVKIVMVEDHRRFGVDHGEANYRYEKQCPLNQGQVMALIQPENVDYGR
jgi:hypothetical protein